MKKSLLSTLAVAATMVCANAEIVELDMNNATDFAGTYTAEVPAAGTSSGSGAKYQPLQSLKVDGYTFTLDKASGSTEPAYYYAMSTSTSPVNTLRPYKNNTLTITAPEGVEMSQITLTMSAGDFSATTTNGSYSNKVWTAATKTNTVTLTCSTNARISKLAINTGDAETIEYKKAANIAAFLEAADAENATEITSPVTAVYQSGKYLFVKDETASLVVYGTLNTKYNNGDVIPAGIVGTFMNYSQGNLQMSNPVADTFKAATTGTAVEPDEYPVEELALDLVSNYVVVKNATIAEGSDAKTFELSDETSKIILYNQFGLASIPTESNLTVYGFVGVHNGTLQLLPVQIDGGTPVKPTEYTSTEGQGIFDFATPSKFGLEAPEANVAFEVNNAVFNSGFYSLQPVINGGTTPRLWSCGTAEHGVELRLYDGTTLTVKGAKDFNHITFNCASGVATIGTTMGTITTEGQTATWKGQALKELTLNIAKSGTTSRVDISSIKVELSSEAGIENIAADNTATEIYNLQGVRVDAANAPAGLYISRQGNKSQKIIIR